MTNFLKRFAIFLLFMPGAPLLVYYMTEGQNVWSTLVTACASGIIGYLCTGCFPWLNKADEEDEPELVNALVVKRAAGTATIIDAWVVDDGYIEYLENGMIIKISYPKDKNKPSIVMDVSDTFVVAFNSKVENPEYEHNVDEIHRRSDNGDFVISHYFNGRG